MSTIRVSPDCASVGLHLDIQNAPGNGKPPTAATAAVQYRIENIQIDFHIIFSCVSKHFIGSIFDRVHRILFDCNELDLVWIQGKRYICLTPSEHKYKIFVVLLIHQ